MGERDIEAVIIQVRFLIVASIFTQFSVEITDCISLLFSKKVDDAGTRVHIEQDRSYLQRKIYLTHDKIKGKT